VIGNPKTTHFTRSEYAAALLTRMHEAHRLAHDRLKNATREQGKIMMIILGAGPPNGIGNIQALLKYVLMM